MAGYILSWGVGPWRESLRMIRTELQVISDFLSTYFRLCRKFVFGTVFRDRFAFTAT